MDATIHHQDIRHNIFEAALTKRDNSRTTVDIIISIAPLDILTIQDSSMSMLIKIAFGYN